MVMTCGHLLGGRVSYRQPACGFRSGIEPVLLAAAVPAREGDSVLEAGTGAGAALLCLSRRVPGIRMTGVEADAGLAELAAVNARENGVAAIDIVAGRIEDAALPRLFDHAMANPPYHQPAGSPSPLADREAAKRGSDVLMRIWIDLLSAALVSRGSLTLIVTAGMVTACLAAMSSARCPCTTIFPLWPKAERPAKLVMLRGIKHARSPMRLMPGIVLHRADGRFTDAAQDILGEMAALSLDR